MTKRDAEFIRQTCILDCILNEMNKKFNVELTTVVSHIWIWNFNKEPRVDVNRLNTYYSK